MRAATIILLAIRVSLIYGRLTVLRGKQTTYSYSHDSRRLLCVSEDDHGGLIWNSNLNWNYSSYEFSDRGGNMNFQTTHTYRANHIDCNFNSYENCMTLWNTSNWSLTNSVTNPMGPVFDRRWEEFREYNNFGNYYDYRPADPLGKTGASVFSVRGSQDAHLLLCDGNQYNSDFCYWIIIGGWVNTKSIIRKCPNGVPQPPAYPERESECAQEQAGYFHRPLSSKEWRTFVLTWNKTNGNITLYDTEKMILTYVDDGKRPTNLNKYYQFYYRSPVASLLRFHTYSFLHTTDPRAVLTSPTINPANTNLCFQLLIGLCVECEIEISLVNPLDQDEREILKIISGSKVAGAHRLPMWQYVQINQTVSTDYATGATIMLFPKLTKKSENPSWAVANFRLCPPRRSLRVGMMEATQDYYNYVYYWPPVTCQKLFYDENVVVDSVQNATLNMKFDDLYCPEGKVGPYCSLNCWKDLESNVECMGTVICEKSGCTCTPGFIGENCLSKCGINKYGHDCNETCGSCKRQNCNFKTGECMSGCDNSNRFNIPPFCKMGIDTLPPPVIDFINETTVRAILPARQEYKEVSSKYIFNIQTEGETESIPLGFYKKILQNTTTLVGYIDYLKPGTFYKISCKLFITEDNISIVGEWQNVTTRCKPTIQFQVESADTSLTLVGTQRTEAYSCPENWYDLLLENVETGLNVVRSSLPKLPYKYKHLTPYTLYRISIAKQNAVLFSTDVRTREGVPSQVMNLTKSFSSKIEITLNWEPPKYPNGEILRYEITLQVIQYFGCSNHRLRSPQYNISTFTSATTITFPDLQPYAQYIANITACNTLHRGDGTPIKFTTQPTDIPTVSYSNLKFQNFVLTWDLPKDCSKISGPIVAKILIDGISDAVKNYHDMRQTTKFKINLESRDRILYGAETYRARIYAMRDYNKPYNEFLYDEHIFTTPPKPPPPLRNLEIYEVDSQAKLAHFRWQKPLPPINGIIEYYMVFGCISSCQFLMKVSPENYCKLWENYNCATIEQSFIQFSNIKMSAVNINVSMNGPPSFAKIPFTEAIPEAPESFTYELLDKGVINVSWSHPWRTGGPLKKFVISTEIISTNLRKEIPESQKQMIYEHFLTDYRLQYIEQLHLLTSSSYKVSIRAVTNLKVYGDVRTIRVETPLAIEFEEELKSEVCNQDSTILLHIPKVLNDTKNSVMSVVVKGPQPCEHYTRLNPNLNEHANIKYYEIAWRAATFPTNEFAGKVFTVGDDKIYNGVVNCPLKPEESYIIMVIVETEWESMNGPIMVAKTTSIGIGKVPRRHDEAWFIPIAIFLLVGAVGFYFYRRKRKRLLKALILENEMALVHNTETIETKSMISTSKQVMASPTPSNKESISRTTTPDGPMIVLDVNLKEGRTSLVKVKDFEDYVKQAIQSGLLDKQYETFPRGQTKPWEYGELPQNKQKNRYGNLIAYDENRVILKKLPDDPFSDYINASYIKGYKKEKCYIATQGPKANTVIDFWRMIWQEETLIICMLANLIEGRKVKCEQYWPDVGKKKKYGDVIVLNAKHNVFADYTFRILHVTCGEETRKVEHLHYTAWPDHGVPLYTHSVVTYLKKLLATPPGNGPVVVHCSAGVGRTGTIILCDICLRRAAAEGVVDVYTEIEGIRKQRANMVDNKQQYLLAHLALVECLLSFPTALPCNEVLPLKIKELKKQLGVQLQRLQDTAWQDEALRPTTIRMQLSERNLAKNRYPELVSEKMGRVYLKRYPATDEDSDYISAVYVDGVRLQNQYLATQLPLPSTFNDFWRMIADYNIELVVMLQPPDPGDPTCCPIVPTNGEFKPTPYMNVRTKEVTDFEFYTSQKLLLVDNSEKPAREQQVTILCSTEWKPGRDQDPPAVMTLVTLWQAAERICRGDGPTVVLCHDGVTGCGLYLALSFLLERMAVERECDVCLAIRAVRRSRPDFVRSLEHIEYLYDAAITYLEYFETYANFT